MYSKVEAADVESLLDQLPVDISEASFAGWRFTGDSPRTAVISFKGPVPSAMTTILNDAPQSEFIELEGGSALSLADHQDLLGESLSTLGVARGEGWYDEKTRQLVTNVTMDPERWSFPAVGLFEAVNDEIVRMGGRALTERELSINEFGPEYITEPRAPGEP